MKFVVFFFLLLLACLYISEAQGAYENCCLKHARNVKTSTRRRVVRYRVQEPDGGCNIPAIVFTLKEGRSFCANPDHPWVKRLMNNMDKRKG